MKLITKIKKADALKKPEIWLDADMNRSEMEEVVKEMIFSLPGYYNIHRFNSQFGVNLVEKVGEVYGWMPAMLISESMLLGLQVMYPKKVYASFTLGLDVIEIKKGA